MTEVRIVFDEDGLDRVDPSGQISIIADDEAISAAYVYLDSWLDALITGLRAVEAGRSADIDLVEEPDPLIFQPQNGGLRITYRDKTLTLKSINEFHQALREAAKDFVDTLTPHQGTTGNQLLDSIRNFA